MVKYQFLHSPAFQGSRSSQVNINIPGAERSYDKPGGTEPVPNPFEKFLSREWYQTLP